jgi:hypothetical protein
VNAVAWSLGFGTTRASSAGEVEHLDARVRLVYPGRVKPTHRTTLAGIGMLFVAAAGCKGKDEAAEKKAAEKKALEAALAVVGKPIATISAYLPYTEDLGAAEKFATKQRGDMQRATEHAANEIRHAANSARQFVDHGDSPATKALADAFTPIATSCTDANEPAKLDTCRAKVKALDDALGKFETACAAAGITAKVPRVGPVSITEDVKKAMAPYLKARGPGQAEVAFAAKRADPQATVAAVLDACRAAATETEQVADTYKNADEPIRILAATHKMSLDSQCNALTAAETTQKEVTDCRKKPTTPECKISCAKAKTIMDGGIPAAAFVSLEKEHAEVCEKKK